MLRITPDEYRHRLEGLQDGVRAAGLDVLVVSALDSVYYLTGAGFEPLERPFFLLVRPRQAPLLLVPKLDHEHMKKAHGVAAEDIHSYWDFPAPTGRGWPEQLREHIGTDRTVGVEPSLPQEIADQLRGYSLRMEPFVERQRLVKSVAEVGMIRRSAEYADFGVERLLAASYFGATVAEGFAETRTVTSRIIREVDDWEFLTTKVLVAAWAAPGSAMPHSVPDLCDRYLDGPHVALVLTRVNGYAAECERTYFTAPPSNEVRKAFSAMMEARRMAFGMIRPGLLCGELDAAVNDFLRTEGYDGEERRLHRTGHGLGLGNHEAPWIAEGSDDRLAENMLISIEPGIYLPGVGGIRHSDTVLVTNEGHELLTRYPVDLDALVIHGWKPIARVKGLFVRRAMGLADKCRNVRPQHAADLDAGNGSGNRRSND
jgi:Xaa-Pro dipeptidase